MLCCTEYSSSSYSSCSLTLTRPNGMTAAISLIGAAVTDIRDASGSIAGFKITSWRGDQSIYVSGASSITKSTVMANIKTCHTSFNLRATP